MQNAVHHADPSATHNAARIPVHDAAHMSPESFHLPNDSFTAFQQALSSNPFATVTRREPIRIDWGASTVASNPAAVAMHAPLATDRGPDRTLLAQTTVTAKNAVPAENNNSQPKTHTASPHDAVTSVVAIEPRPPRKRAKIDRAPTKEDDSPEPSNFEEMEAENGIILAKDDPAAWQNGVVRFRASPDSAASVLSWVVENTTRKLSVVATDGLTLDGFHNWDAVHAGVRDDERQLQHTFVIARAQRVRALKIIPGLDGIVNAAKAAIHSLQLKDTPEKLEWLTGHILNQGDVNARFGWHQDTNEERKETGGRRDRRVLYSVIVKLNRGGCTSLQVCGKSEVYYHSVVGSGLIFRSDLHHRTEKSEPGVWKLAMFFGVFL